MQGTAAKTKNSGVPRGASVIARAASAATMAAPPHWTRMRNRLPPDILSRRRVAALLLKCSGMSRHAATLIAFLATIGAAAAWAQTTTTADTPSKVQSLRNLKFDQGGGLHLSKHFAIVFGGIKQGSGAALGPAVSSEFSDGSYVQVKAVYSVRRFKLLQARYDSRPMFDKRGVLLTRVRWQDAPERSLYHLGPDSPDRRAEYSERRIEWNGAFRYALQRKTVLLAGAGMERYSSSGGWIDEAGPDAPDEIPQTPGLGTRPWF